jgi:asparagine synthase (glutamine-hydrolysing)
MCGIAGIFNFDGKPINVESLCKMTKIVAYRGPDDRGIVLFNSKISDGNPCVIKYKNEESWLREAKSSQYSWNVGLGHARLSIIDLSERGHQPMTNTDGSLWVVHNGEIYNYLELRAELISKGYEFRSNSDTEVILNAYQEWGADCLNRFNGMWAFAIWDRRKRSLFCARDRFGVKPFYYYLNNDVFIFASEIKQILECEEYQRNPNEKMIYDYLVIGLGNHTSETFFKDIYQLRGGEYAIVDLDSRTFQKKRFYDLSNVCVINRKEGDYYEELKELFIDSVNLRLRSDVPVGSCLSGGLDSSAVVSVGSALLKEKGDSIFNTFTACWKNEEIDERKYAEVVIASSGANGNYVYPSSEELAQDLSRLIWHQEEPFGSLSIFAQWSVMKAARDSGIPVLLDGQGGDEVFLGYERYYAWFLLELIKKGKLIRFIHELIKAGENSRLTQKQVILFYVYFNFNWVRALRLYRKTKPFMNADFMKSYNIPERLDIFRRIKTVADLQVLEIQEIQLAQLLKYADRNSMAFSIESRLPFLDYRLVEFALSVPSEYKIRDGWTKNLIREGMKGIISEDIRKRKNKLGFEVPQAGLMQTILPQLRAKVEKGTMLEKYFNMDLLLNTLKRNDVNNLVVWKALCLDLWFREFFE